MTWSSRQQRLSFIQRNYLKSEVWGEGPKVKQHTPNSESFGGFQKCNFVTGLQHSIPAFCSRSSLAGRPVGTSVGAQHDQDGTEKVLSAGPEPRSCPRMVPVTLSL